MRIASLSAAVAGVLVAGLFVARAATGVPAAWAQRRGRALEADRRFAEAGPMLDRGAVGGERVGALWRSGRARLGLWYALPAPERAGPAGEDALRAAAVRFLEARVESPGSAWLVAALGYVYGFREKAVQAGRTVDLAALENGPWSLIGDDGRIAIGLVRASLEREPNYFETRDQLVLLLEDIGLHDEALRAIGESARVLPDFGDHPDLSFESLPRDLVEAFWRASRAVNPAEAPFQIRERHLLSLGKLGRRLGHLSEAEQDLRAALREPGTKLAHAEDAFHLALVLIDLGRFDEAEPFLALALREPVFAPGVADARADVALKQERFADALEQLREARRLRPRDVGTLLQFAWVAQKVEAWDQSEEALRWAMLVRPEDPAPPRAMVELFLAQGDKAKARRALDEYVQAFGRTADAERFERELVEPLDPADR